MKAYQNRYRPLTEIQPGGGGLVGFISYRRLAEQFNAESIDAKVVDYPAVSERGIDIYWKDKDAN